jgi:hypothetical protein
MIDEMFGSTGAIAKGNDAAQPRFLHRRKADLDSKRTIHVDPKA